MELDVDKFEWSWSLHDDQRSCAKSAGLLGSKLATSVKRGIAQIRKELGMTEKE